MTKMVWFIAIMLPLSLQASQTQSLVIAGYEAISLGTFDGTSLFGNGSITLAPKSQSISVDLPGSLLTMMMIKPDVYWVSSVGPAAILEAEKGQKAKEIFQTDRPLITSIIQLKDGRIAASSAPSGGVFIFKNRETKDPVFWPVPEVEMILGAAAFGNDIYLVGGGDNGGRLLKMTLPSGSIEVLAELKEAYAKSIFIADSKGGPQIFFGGTELGTIYRYAAGKIESIYAGPQAEVTSIWVDKAGRVFAAFVDSEGRLAQTVSAQQPTPDAAVQSWWKKDIQSSRVMLIEPKQAPRMIWESRQAGVFSLFYDEPSSQLYAGTGMQGRVLRLNMNNERTADILSHSEEAGPVVALEKNKEGQLVTLTAGSGVISSIDLESESSSGAYISRVIDAGSAARFGAILVDDGRTNPKEISWRMGNTARPDNTWGSFGSDATLGRYAQFKIVWPKRTKKGEMFNVRQFRVSYLPINQKPVIQSARLLLPNERIQMQEPQAEWTRSVNLDENAFRISDNRYSFSPQMTGNYTGILSFMPNFRSVYVWAQDSDFDVLRYRFVMEKLTDKGEVKERKLLKDWDIEPFASFDTSEVGDGRYRIAVQVDDFLTNGPKRTLDDRAITESFELSSSLPEFKSVEAKLLDGKKTLVKFTVEARIPLAVVQCADAKGKWFSVDPQDEITDESSESFDLHFSFAPKFDTITCQAMDIDQNVRKIDIKVRGS